MSAPDACTSCGQHAVVFDPAEGFRVCEACGYMPEPDAQDLRDHTVNPDGGQVGVFVPHGSNAAIGAAGGDFRHLAPKADTREAYRRYLKDRAKHFAAALKLPTTLHLEAQGYLLDAMTPLPESKAQYVDILAACCVYATARLHEEPLLIAEVASLLQQEANGVGQQYRALVRVLRLKVPPVSCPALIVRAAAACTAISGGGSASLRAVRAHRAVRAAQSMVEWGTAEGYFAGRSPSVFSAAALLVAMEGLGLVDKAGAAAGGISLVQAEICSTLMASHWSVEMRACELRRGLVQAARDRGLIVAPPDFRDASCKARRLLSQEGKAAGFLPIAVRHIDLLIKPAPARPPGRSLPAAAAAPAPKAAPPSSGAKRPRRLIPGLCSLAENLAGRSAGKQGQLQHPAAAHGEECAPFRLKGKRYCLAGRKQADAGGEGVEAGRGILDQAEGSEADPELSDEELDMYLCSPEEVEMRQLLIKKGLGLADE